MKKILLCVLMLIVLPLNARAEEKILSFGSVIRVLPDASLDVVETITVNAQGQQIKRGIYRDFPTIYPDGHGQVYEVTFDVVSVMRDGVPENYFFQDLSNGRRVMIGRKEYFLNPGAHTYQIHYRTQGQLGFFENFDELYWNVTGNGWDFPIEQASATVILPEAVKNQVGLVKAYTGGQGQKGESWMRRFSDSGDVVIDATQTLNPREGLTIVVQWPKGFVTPHDRKLFTRAAPSASSSADHQAPGFLEWILDAGVILGCVGLLYYYVTAWWRYGRDAPKQTVIPQFYPPEGFSPGLVGYIHRDEDSLRTSLTAGVLNLAVGGRLKIFEEKGLLGFGKKTVLQQISGTLKTPLFEDEAELERSLFLYGPAFELSSSNYEPLYEAQKKIIKIWQNQYNEHYLIRNRQYFLRGLGITALVVLAAFFVRMWTGAEWLWMAIAIFAAVVNFVFSRLLKAPTILGQRLKAHIEGFRMYLETAEKYHLNQSMPFDRTPEVFEKYLPYALALGVQVKWAEQFADVFASMLAAGTTYQPGWYSGSSWNHHDPSRSISQMSSALNYSVTSASTPPGSSSGGGGGGFSGGGGGGGGGGGW